MEIKLNQSAISEFILLHFSDTRELRILYFLAFLAIYLTIITGNLLIIVAIAFSHRLHTPMYFYLMILATQDVGQVSVIYPRIMVNVLMNAGYISYSECVAQVFWYSLFLGCDVFLLTVMAYDRYIAVCHPLQYEMLMNKEVCTQMIAGVWAAGFLYGVLHAGGTFASSFCSNVIPQFFCEIPHLLKLACSETYLFEVGAFACSCVFAFGCFVFIIVSYVHIFISVFRIPSGAGKQKAFSTCLPHLIVFSLLFITGFLAYIRPLTGISSHFDIAFTLIYSLMPPLMNPAIYSMRNKEIKNSLSKLLCQFQYKAV